MEGRREGMGGEREGGRREGGLAPRGIDAPD